MIAQRQQSPGARAAARHAFGNRQQGRRSQRGTCHTKSHNKSIQKFFEPTPPSRCSSGTLRITTSGSFQTQPGGISQASTNDTEAKCETKHKNVAIARDTGPSRRMCVGLHLSDRHQLVTSHKRRITWPATLPAQLHPVHPARK